MSIVKGVLEHGLIRPRESLPLPDGTEVEIVYNGARPASPEALKAFIEDMRRGIDMGGWKWKGRDDLYDRHSLR